jgi:signal transduction histidine kinase
MKPEAKACCVDEWSVKWRWMVILALGMCLVGCVPNSDSNALHIRAARVLSLPGLGYTRPPDRIDATSLPTDGWRAVALPDVAARDLVARGGPEQTLTDWYMLDLRTSPSSDQPRYLYLPRWKTIGQIAIYGDGRLLYSAEGSMAHNGYNHPLLVRLNPALGQSSPKSVLLRIDRLRSSGRALSTAWVGPGSALVWRFQMRQILQVQLPYIGGAAFLAVGVFSLAVWVRLRRDSLYLLFFATSVTAFVRMLHYHIGGSHLPIDDEWFEWVTVSSLMWLIVLCHCFMERLHERPLKGLTPSLVSATLLCNVLTAPNALPQMPHLTSLTPLLYMLLLPLALAVFFDAVRNGFRSRLREVWLMAAWLFVTTLCCVYDLALQNNMVSPEGIYTNPFAIMGLFVMFGYIMYRRYVGAVVGVEQANLHLGERLEARELELMESHNRLREIEHRQTLSNERLRLTQDMHDGLGSALVSALRVVERGNMSGQELSEVLTGCIDDLKLMIDSMEPGEADLLLLLATIRFRLGPRLSAADITLKWEVQDLPALEWLDQRNSLHILRIIQEAFANILKHTSAAEIRVRTGISGDGVLVTIEDNGRGFDVAETELRGKGHGMSNQRRRAKSIGGVASWTSNGSGTSFTLWLPQRKQTFQLRPS